VTTSNASDHSRLERAADIVEIRDALSRYCYGFDRGDVDLAASAYHEDATEAHGPFKGRALDFLSQMAPILRSFEVSVRHITNLRVELDGDTAWTEAAFIAFVREGGSQVDDIGSGRYLDRFERRRGEWRIAARLAVIDWWRREPRNDLAFPPGYESILQWAGRGLGDPEVRSVIGPP
jgi:ketosteroid isomerase-like protein